MVFNLLIIKLISLNCLTSFTNYTGFIAMFILLPNVTRDGVSNTSQVSFNFEKMLSLRIACKLFLVIALGPLLDP
jgi:hypothetical protein